MAFQQVLSGTSHLVDISLISAGGYRRLLNCQAESGHQLFLLVHELPKDWPISAIFCPCSAEALLAALEPLHGI